MKQRWLLVLVSLALVVVVVGFAPVGVTRAMPIGNGVPILYYDFENNTTRTTGENLVEQAVNAGSGPLTKVGGTGTQLTITSVTGAGTFNGGSISGQALSTSGGGWDSATTDPGNTAGYYYQFVVNTSGFSQITISFDNQPSPTGPARVGVLYSTNGTIFNSTTTAVVTATMNMVSFDLSSISAVDNQPSVTIRIYAYAGNASDRGGRSAFTSAGTFRIDNLTVFARTATASKTLLNYPAIGLSLKSGTAFTPTYTDFTVNGGGTISTLASSLNLTNTLVVNSGSALVIPSGSSLTAGTLTNNGTITQTQDVNGSTDVNFINTGNYGGVTINASGNGDLGSTTVAIRGNQACDTANTSVRRCFNITPATATGVNAAVTFFFSNSELNGSTCASMNVYHWAGSWSTPLTVGGRQCATEPYSISVTGVTAFSPFVLASATPNAITLTTFSGSTPTNDGLIAVILLAATALLAGGWVLRRRTQA